MSVESDLRKDGIEVIKKLDTLRINSIARNISIRLCETFPNFNLNQNDLFIKLSRLNMYIAKMPEGMAEANYFYKNTSIYFNEHIADEDLEEFAIHECIHYIQEVKDKNNYLLRMGLCDYTEFKIYGLGLNEAAVQLMASKVISIPKDFVKYFNISFETTSPSYYPLECCLVNQLAYLIGEDVLFESNKTEQEKESRKKEVKYDYKIFAINIDREKLYERINIRVDKMIENGLIEEVENLRRKYNHFPTAMQGLGYKEVVQYFQKELTKEEMIEKIKQESRRYAKRQLTWFRKNKQTIWIDGLANLEDNINIIEKELNK